MWVGNIFYILFCKKKKILVWYIFFNIRLIFIYIYNVLTKIWQNEKLLWTSFKLVLFYTLATFTHPKLTFWRIMHHFVCIHSKCNTNFDILIYRIPWIRQIWCTHSTRFLFQEFFFFWNACMDFCVDVLIRLFHMVITHYSTNMVKCTRP